MRLTLYLLLLISSVGCSTKYMVVVIEPASESSFSENNFKYTDARDSLIDLRMAFIGDAFNYVIFESRIINNGSEALLISHDDFILHLNRKDRNTSLRIKSIDPDQEISYLEDLKKTEKARAKGNDIAAIIGGVAIGTLVSSEAAVIYAVERGINRIGERVDLDNLIRSIDEEILYLKTGVLDHYTLRPGDTLEADLLFQRHEYPATLTLMVDIGGKMYNLDFDQEIEEYRN